MVFQRLAPFPYGRIYLYLKVNCLGEKSYAPIPSTPSERLRIPNPSGLIRTSPELSGPPGSSQSSPEPRAFAPRRPRSSSLLSSWKPSLSSSSPSTGGDQCRLEASSFGSGRATSARGEHSQLGKTKCASLDVERHRAPRVSARAPLVLERERERER